MDFINIEGISAQFLSNYYYVLDILLQLMELLSFVCSLCMVAGTGQGITAT